MRTSREMETRKTDQHRRLICVSVAERRSSCCSKSNGAETEGHYDGQIKFTFIRVLIVARRLSAWHWRFVFVYIRENFAWQVLGVE